MFTSLLLLTISQAPVVQDYQQLVKRVQSGEKVLVASNVTAPSGFESISIPGEKGLWECFLENGKPMMKPVVLSTTFVPSTTPIICRT